MADAPHSTFAGIRNKVFGIYIGLATANIVAWLWALAIFRTHPVLLGTALLAYTFGLRHAVDADHIVAIDNVTRKLMQNGKRPVSTGLYFSLGHSTVVFLASVAIAFTASTLHDRFASMRDIGSIIGTSVSALFLFAIAIANTLILVSITRMFRRVKNGEAGLDASLDLTLANRGMMARLFRKIFALIRASWQMYPLGFLFGLGFDTATEIGVLGMSAAGAAQGLSIWSILVFPALFTAGMTLVDTTDTVLMIGAYGWAFVKPIRKLYYNMTITFISIIVALIVGGVEALGLIADRLGLDQGIWGDIAALNGRFGTLGFVIVGVFVACWIGSILIYRLRGYDRIGTA